jgi:CDP-2,3-bis-(O-geranylgeranyl)-sn-glycerol synthase
VRSSGASSPDGQGGRLCGLSGARWIFLPVLGAPALHAPVLRFDLLRGLKHPIDGGLTWRGRRLLGDNKTWRGALVMASGPTLAAVALHRFDWYRRRLPVETNPLLLGALLGVSTVAGELPNSFFKRRLGIAPGAQRNAALTVFDQADFVLTASALLRPVYRMSARETAEVFAIVAAVHVPINVIGRVLGVRSSSL